MNKSTEPHRLQQEDLTTTNNYSFGEIFVVLMMVFTGKYGIIIG